MNYYARHLGDYAKDTLHLTMLEHGAYNLLLDRYYGSEQPIPADQIYRVALARTPEDRAAVDAVLAEFFTLTDGAWRKGRCDEEIEKAKVRTAAARENGRWGGRPRKNKTEIEPDKNPELTHQKPTGLILQTQQKALQYPITNKEEGSTAGAVLPAQKYAFKGCVIKLTHEDFEAWKKAYSPIDLLAELTARDAWLSSERATDADRKKWFMSTSKYLANRVLELKAKVSVAAPKQITGGWA